MANDFNIAVITPYKGESVDCILRCIDTIKQQDHSVFMHVMISDGSPFPLESSSLPLNVHVIQLPSGCEDTGATPRAIGSIYAIAHHCQGLAYLDIDNTVTSDHIGQAVSLARKGAGVVINERWICEYETGEPLFVDDSENGIMFVDTNTLFLFGEAMMPGAQWWNVPRKKGVRTAAVDRMVWARVSAFCEKRKLTIAKSGVPTVYYRSRWRHHYERVNRIPPSPCKTLKKNDGVFFAHWME